MVHKSKNKLHCRAALQWVWCPNSLRIALIPRINLGEISAKFRCIVPFGSDPDVNDVWNSTRGGQYNGEEV